MSRRASISLAKLAPKPHTEYHRSRRVSLKDGTLTFGGISKKAGPDIKTLSYYRTVRHYPHFRDIDDEITVSFSKSSFDGVAMVDSRPSSRSDPLRQSPPAIVDTNRAASIATSAGGQDSKRPRFAIWPEWNDNDVNGEKWDVAHKGKEKDKGKSPVVQHFFDDPEGKIEMPASLKVDHWKRPQDYITEKTPTIVDVDVSIVDFDLITANEHLHTSELMRYTISHIKALWDMSASKAISGESPEPVTPIDEPSHTWRPWEHIYALCKAGKAPHLPLYNPHGKYIVKLYWMGSWRKVVIDDLLPFDEDGNLLLPATTYQHELWPMLLTKAIIKVASLDYSGGNSSSEFGDCSIIHCLTGWLPEAIPIQSGHINELWNLIQSSVTEWKLPELEGEVTPDGIDPLKKDGTITSETPKEDKSDKDPGTKDSKTEKQDGKSGKEGGKDKGKDGKDKEKGGKDDKKKDKGDKDKDKDKDKHKVAIEENVLPETPEVAVFASYCSTPKYPVKVSVLGEMANASEKLRQTGLSHLYPHPVWITQTRSCPLEAPPPPEKVPAWKLIRPRKKKTTPSSDEPIEQNVPKPIKCLEITSHFVNYKVSPVPIPSDTHRPKSGLERGGTRSRPQTATIDESDENPPDPETLEAAKIKEALQKESTESLTSAPVNTESIASQSVDPLPDVSVANVPKKEKKKSVGGSTVKGGKDGLAVESSGKDRRSSKISGSPVKVDRSRSASLRSDSRTSKLSDAEDKSKDAKNSVSPAPVADPNQPAGGLSDPFQEVCEINPETGLPFVVEVNIPKAKKVWVDFDHFSKCFKTVYIFHKTNTYPCNFKHSDMKNLDKQIPVQNIAPTGTKGDKKTVAASGAVNTSSSKTSNTPTHARASSPPHSVAAPGSDDKAPYFLFVDNLRPTEIVVSFSALSRWHEPPTPLPNVKDSHTSLKGKDKDPDKDPTAVLSSSLLDGSTGKEHGTTPSSLQPGTLIAEPYSWKSLVMGQPILRLRTTATRAAVLSLPAGRHVLRFMMNAPLGYHVHLCSSVQFVFGDEETVMSQLTKESCRFVENATQVISAIGKCINSFNEMEAFHLAWEELVSSHCPYRKDKLMSKQYHFQVFNQALYRTLKKALGDLSTPEMAFAWRAFNFDITSHNILGLSTDSRPATGTTSHRGSAKTSNKKQAASTDGEQEKPEHPWTNRDPTADEHVASVKIQKSYRGHRARKIRLTRTPGTNENLKAMDALQKAWSAIEPNAEQLGLYLFRSMFKTDPDLMQRYPFYKDEWNKISYADYQGTYPDQPPNTWFIVFREVFFVTEEMLVVPKLYVPINTCLLRVINNDTGEEMSRVFQRVAPYIYKRNKRGYTFVAEARTTDLAAPSGKWRMRLIGSLSPLPAPAKNEVNSTFSVREIRDYYIPNNKNIIFRYTVKVHEEHLTSIQVGTSKPDVYIKLSILDNEEEVLSTVGKGHAVVPAMIFLKDINADEDSKRASSRASNRGKVAGSVQNVKGKRSNSARSADGRTSRGSHQSEAGYSDELDDNQRPHKYVIQATVIQSSWPLSETSWVFVQQLREIEKNELKITNKERPPSPAKNEKAPTGTSKTGKPGKGGKDKTGKDKDSKNSRPPSQQFDLSKPHWTFRVISDGTCTDDIDMKKDTERADEIRAMKKAWEDAEPGRAAKAQQSRLKYLNSHMIRVQDDDEAKPEDQSMDGSTLPEPHESVPSYTPASFLDNLESEGTLTLEPPPAPTPKEILQPIDLTPFIRRSDGPPRFLDEAEIQRKLQEKQLEIENYKSYRKQVEQWREQDRAHRNYTKQKQLEDCERLQAALDDARRAYNEPREAFRQKYLEAERIRLEEISAQEAAMKAELEAKSPKGRKSAKGKKSPTGKKKK